MNSKASTFIGAVAFFAMLAVGGAALGGYFVLQVMVFGLLAGCFALTWMAIVSTREARKRLSILLSEVRNYDAERRDLILQYLGPSIFRSGKVRRISQSR